MEENTSQTLAEDSVSKGNGDEVNTAGDSEHKANVENMEVLDNNRNKDDNVGNPQDKDSGNCEPNVEVGEDKNEPNNLELSDDLPEEFFDEMLKDEFLDSMAVVDAWNPDDSDGSNTEKKRGRRDGRKDDKGQSKRGAHDRRDLKRDREISNKTSRQDKNSRLKNSNNKDRESRSSVDKSIDKNLDKRERKNRNSRDRSTDRNRNTRDTRNRNSRDRSTEKNRNSRDRHNRNSRERSTDRNRNNRDRHNRNSRERSTDRNRNSSDRRTDRNRNSRDRSTDRNRNSRGRSNDRNRNSRDRHNRNSRDRSTDKNRNNRDRHNRNSRERSTDRNRKSRDRSTDRNRNSRDRNTDRNRNSRDRSTDRNRNNRDRQNRNSRDRSPDRNQTNRDRRNRNSRERSIDKNLNNKDKKNRNSREKSPIRLTYVPHFSRIRDQIRERSHERRERKKGQSSEGGDKIENTTDKCRDGRSDKSARKDTDRKGSTDTRDCRDKSKDMTERSFLESHNKDLGNKGKNMERCEILKGKMNIPKLDTCIKELDDLMPPGTEDEFIFRLRDESVKLKDDLKKKNNMLDEKHESDKTYEKERKSGILGNDGKVRQQFRRMRVSRFDIDYKDIKYTVNKLEERKDRSSYSDELDRRKMRADVDRKIRSDSAERKRALSKDRQFPWSSSKRQRSLSIDKHYGNFSDSERNNKHFSKDKQYKDSSIKYDGEKDKYRRSTSGDKDGNRKSLQKEGDLKDKELGLSPVSDVERLSTPTLSDSPVSAGRERWNSYDRTRRYSYSPVSVRSEFSCSCVRPRLRSRSRSPSRSRLRSRSRSSDSFTSLSSDSPYERPRRKRLPFLKELERKLAANHNKTNSQLTNFSFAALYQNSSSQAFSAPTSYPAPAVYSQPPVTYTTAEMPPPAQMPTSFGPNYPPPSVAPDYTQPYIPTDMSQAPPSYMPLPPNYSEASVMPSGSLPPIYSDGSAIEMQGPQPMQMPIQLPVPSPSQFSVPPHFQLSVPPPSQLPVQPMQSPSQMPMQLHMQQLSVPPPSQMPMPQPVHLPVPSPSQLMVPPPSHLSAPPPMQLEMPQPTFLPSPSITTSASQPLFESPMSFLKTQSPATNVENILKRKNEKPQCRRPVLDVPPPPKISQLYNDKKSLSSILEASVKVAVASAKKQMPIDPSLITRCEEILFTLQAVNEPSFITSGPIILQESSRPSRILQDIPDDLKKYQSPLHRKPDVQLNFTNISLFEEFSSVSSEITASSSVTAATSAVGFNNARDVRAKQDKHYQSVKDSKNHDSSVKDSKNHDSSVKDSKHHDSYVKDSKHHDLSVKDSKHHDSSVKDSKHHDSSVKDSKHHDSSGKDSKYHNSSVKDSKQPDSSNKESKHPDSDVKESKQYSAKDYKKRDVKPQKNCSVCLERADKIMIWNCTQTPRVEMKSVAIQVSIPVSDLERSFDRNDTWRSDLGMESDHEGSKNSYASEEYRRLREEEASFYRSLTPPTLQKSSFSGSRLPFSSGLYSQSSSSRSLAPAPRKGILKSSSNSQQEQFPYRQSQSSLAADFKALQSARDTPGSRMERLSGQHFSREFAVNKLTDLHDKDLPGNKPLPSARSLLGHSNVSYPSMSFRSSPFTGGSSLSSGSRFESILSRSHGKSTLPELLPQTTFDYQHSDRPTPVLPDPSSRQ